MHHFWQNWRYYSLSLYIRKIKVAKKIISNHLPNFMFETIFKPGEMVHYMFRYLFKLVYRRLDLCWLACFSSRYLSMYQIGYTLRFPFNRLNKRLDSHWLEQIKPMGSATYYFVYLQLCLLSCGGRAANHHDQPTFSCTDLQTSL